MTNSKIDLSIPSGAIFTEDMKFRYALWRVWSTSRPILLSISLNPSVANSIRNDPTVIRDMRRAEREGFGGLLKGNLYAYVSTDPNALLKDGDFVGEETDFYLKEMIRLSARHLCGWGSFKPVKKRAPIVLAMIPEPYCLGVNADGQPRHPLYIGYDIPMIKYTVKEN
jgi:hypothetical protein